MSLLKRIKAETWIVIVTLIIGFISTNAVRAYKQDDQEVTLERHEEAIVLNSKHRIQAEAQPEFVPRPEFDDVKEDIKEIKEGQKQMMQVLLEMKK